jgi:predicted enzyme related to lactoylglutathione lyase
MMTTIQRMRTIGKHATAHGGRESMPLPWNFTDTVFRCAWEYPVSDFHAEVGFYVDVLGFSTIALDEEYALFTTPGEALTFACRRHEHVSGDYTGHILCFMTKDIESFAESLEARVGANAITRLAGSPVQTVLRIASPAGVQIDIWEFPA